MLSRQRAVILGSGHASSLPWLARPVVRRPVADEANRGPYLVEYDLRGLSSTQLATLHRALADAVRRESRRGSQIRYVQRIDVLEEHRWLCLFEAAGPELVRSINDIVQFPMVRVLAVRNSVAGVAGFD
jgi:hypothetical protein